LRVANRPAVQGGLAKRPIFLRSLVKRIKGMTANGSCRLSTTWLKISSLAMPLSPWKAVTNNAGTIAMERVSSRRIQGGSFN
jgi:hypothetical protein